MIRVFKRRLTRSGQQSSETSLQCCKAPAAAKAVSLDGFAATVAVFAVTHRLSKGGRVRGCYLELMNMGGEQELGLGGGDARGAAGSQRTGWGGLLGDIWSRSGL